MPNSPTYLPEGFQVRHRRRILDVNPAEGWVAWEDEGWDGHQDATVRPETVRVKLTVAREMPKTTIPALLKELAVQVKAKVTMDPLRDHPDLAWENLRRIKRAEDRKRRLEMEHMKVITE